MIGTRAILPSFALAAVVAAGGGCATTVAATGWAGASERIESRLFFGANIRGHPGVSAADWRRFLAEEVTPRFPDGLTVVPARGQWRSSETGEIERETSYILTLLHDGEGDADGALREIAAAYKQRFAQESVLRIDRRVWVRFE